MELDGHFSRRVRCEDEPIPVRRTVNRQIVLCDVTDLPEVRGWCADRIITQRVFLRTWNSQHHPVIELQFIGSKEEPFCQSEVIPGTVS